MRRAALLALLTLLVPSAGTAARVPTEARALAAVTAILHAHARPCRVSVDRVAAEPIADPVVSSLTTAWRVEARVRRFGEARLRTVADWRVDARGPLPDSPLAGQLAVGCEHVDPGEPATPEQWHSLPYLAADGGFYLTGNEAWAGSVETVPTGRAELSLARYPWGERFRYVWSEACTAAPQQVELHRTVYLPGTPAAARATLASVAFRSAGAAANPVRSLRLLVNGRVALAVRGSGAAPERLPAEALALFVDGANDVALVARKRRSRACNDGPRSLQVGIAFELAGRFSSDLTVSTAGVTLPGFHREGGTFYGRTARTTFGRAGSLRFAIRNEGPSAAPVGTFTLDLDGSARIAFLARTVSRDVLACETGDALGDFSRPPPYRLVCTLADLAAGTTFPLELRYRFRAHGSFTERRARLAWTLSSPQAPAPAAGTATIVFCGAHASSSGCGRAP